MDVIRVHSMVSCNGYIHLVFLDLLMACHEDGLAYEAHRLTPLSRH